MEGIYGPNLEIIPFLHIGSTGENQNFNWGTISQDTVFSFAPAQGGAKFTLSFLIDFSIHNKIVLTFPENTTSKNVEWEQTDNTFTIVDEGYYVIHGFWNGSVWLLTLN